MRTSTAFIWAIISGILLYFAFPPFGFGFLAYAAIIPLFFVADSFGPKKVLLWVWISGLVFLGLSLSWIRHITWAGLIFAVPVFSVLLCIALRVYEYYQEVLATFGIVYVSVFNCRYRVDSFV